MSHNLTKGYKMFIVKCLNETSDTAMAKVFSSKNELFSWANLNDLNLSVTEIGPKYVVLKAFYAEIDAIELKAA